MILKRWKIYPNRLLIFILCLATLLIIIYSVNRMRFNVAQRSSLTQNESIELSAENPIVYNVTANATYFKNGDWIELSVNCDQANYSVFANFSTIDDKFLPSPNHTIDQNNGTYTIRYRLNLSNTRPDGQYQVIINATNTTSGLFSLYNNTYLNLDNTPPNIFITTPQNGAYLTTFNVTIGGFMNATNSKIKYVALNDSRFEFLINSTGEVAGNFLIVNKTIITEGAISLRIGLSDSVNWLNYTSITFTLDNTIPNLTGEVTNLGSNYTVAVLGYAKGTFTPITKFIFNMTDYFDVLDDPTGKLVDDFFLYNLSMVDGIYTLNITITDSVNLSNSLLMPFIVDTTPPWFESIKQNISEPEYDQAVNVSIVNPYDEVSGIQNITLLYSTDNQSSWNPIDITTTSYGIIPPFDYGTIVFYKINLIDKAGNFKTSQIYNYRVIETIPPQFEAIIQNISKPEYYQNVSVSIINPHDAISGIKNIILFYSTNNGSSWELCNITANHSGIIPAFDY
ncbi:MAG: hypothetical protein ACFFD2_27915, partial [Promethearchaeota archaeon]